MNIQRFQRSADLAAALASDLLSMVQQTPAVVLGFATGRTPLPLYRELRERTTRSLADWSQVRTFNLDEFVSPGAAGERYRSFMHDELFGHVNLQSEHIHLLNGQAIDLDRECGRYEEAIERAGGIDLQLLGLGENGHIGFNEPAETLTARTHIATLEPATRERNAWLFDGDVALVPERALSMGMATIFRARAIVLLATGSEKADAVQRMVEGPIASRFPASLLQLHSNLRVFLDDAAAAALNRR